MYFIYGFRILDMSNLNLTKCPICGSDLIIKGIELKDYKISQEQFQLASCAQCDQLFTQNPPTELNSGDYYKSERYISHSNSNKGIINYLYHIVRIYMLRRKRKIISNITSAKNLIDIGCGTGYFLNEMQRNGYRVNGIERSPEARQFCFEKFKLDVFPPDYIFNDLIQNKFEIATMWHVLEHIYDPNKYLKAIHKILQDESYLFIAVPNYKSNDGEHYRDYWAGYDVPRHLWHFDTSTITNLVEGVGFQLVSLHRLPFDSYYVSLLSESYKKNRFFVFMGLYRGLISHIVSLFKIKRTSSILYVFKKK